MTESEALLLQVYSDLQAAELVYVEADEATYCQAAAKYQQAAEKIVKAVCASVEEKGKATFQNRYTHNLGALFTVLTLPSLKPLDAVFDTSRQTQINSLMQIAPTRSTTLRNTEYPFQGAAGEWQAPAAKGVFSKAEVTEYAFLSSQLLTAAKAALAELFP